MRWKDGDIVGCDIRPFRFFRDERGWLAELFRIDELPAGLQPEMGYLSSTEPGIVRGPHEHVYQTDVFVFFSGSIRLYLWDARTASSSYGCRTVMQVGEADPVVVIVPPGIVHAYQNAGSEPALILNLPNLLYGGPGRSEPIDEIRHEEDAESIYQIDPI